MKRFTLGIGAQKGGTSWLYHYMAQDPAYHSGLLHPSYKELRVWDHREIAVSNADRHGWTTRKAPADFDRRRRLTQLRSRTDLLLWIMEHSERAYFSHVDWALRNGGVTADISPSYARLDPATLRKIREQVEARGIEFRCVLLMRDPVRRCQSSFEMRVSKNRENLRDRIASGAADPLAEFENFYKSDVCRWFTQYDVTIAHALQAMPREQLYLGLYEDLFTGSDLKALSEFAGVSHRPDLLTVQRNSRPKLLDIGEEQLKNCARYYRKTYAEMARILPASADRWEGSRWL